MSDEITPTRGQSMKTLLFIALTAWPLAVVAERNIVTIPGQGWHLVVDTPPLTSSESTGEQGLFSYTGADGNSGITFSIHTEDMKGGSNKQCRDEYWAKAQKNPYVVKASAVPFETPTILGVTYRSEGEYKGQPFTTVNSHGYFVKGGKCVDLHVSQIPYSDEGRKKVESVVRTSKVMQ